MSGYAAFIFKRRNPNRRIRRVNSSASLYMNRYSPTVNGRPDKLDKLVDDDDYFHKYPLIIKKMRAYDV